MTSASIRRRWRWKCFHLVLSYVMYQLYLFLLNFGHPMFCIIGVKSNCHEGLWHSRVWDSAVISRLVVPVSKSGIITYWHFWNVRASCDAKYLWVIWPLTSIGGSSAGSLQIWLCSAGQSRSRPRAGWTPGSFYIDRYIQGGFLTAPPYVNCQRRYT